MLDPVADAPRTARRYVKDALSGFGFDDLIDNGVLGASELVTNACLHARTPMTVRVRVGPGGRPRIEVTDGSSVHPVQRPANRTAATGRGLRLLSAAGSWGFELSAGGKTVWFEPASDLDPAAFALTASDTDLDAL